jgi:hypothetical protein
MRFDLIWIKYDLIFDLIWHSKHDLYLYLHLLFLKSVFAFVFDLTCKNCMNLHLYLINFSKIKYLIWTNWTGMAEKVDVDGRTPAAATKPNTLVAMMSGRSGSSKPKRKHRAGVWAFFEDRVVVSKKDEKKKETRAFCTQDGCKAHPGWLIVHGATTNLLKHLRDEHPALVCCCWLWFLRVNALIASKAEERGGEEEETEGWFTRCKISDE